jgi:prolyl 4-hydroxylase
MGGATAFPYLRLRIPARKGAAAFWYNLKASGASDYFTRHAGCPVLLGTKWIANRWIREHGQEFRRRCVPENFVDEKEDAYYQEFF